MVRLVRRFGFALTSALVCLVLTAGSAVAQQGTAGLQGQVVDEQGGVLPGVPVVARSQEAGTFRETVSAADGTYRFLGMQPGLYILEAELGGFAPYRATGVRLEVGQTASVDIELTLEVQNEEITVTTEAPIVDTSSSEVGGIVTSRDLTELPSVNRNFTSFLALLPGAVPSYNTSSFGADSVQPSGQPAGNVNYNIDGGANNDSARGGASGAQARIPIEAIQEFQFLTGQFSAEYGGVAGAVVNAVSKSGTNVFSGSIFSRSKTKGTIAQDYFARKADLPEADTKEHQFGFTIGGPIVRDRAHFFSSTERILLDRGVTLNIPARPELSAAATWKSRVWNIFNRFDHQLTANHHWGLRWLAEWSPQRSRLTNESSTLARASAAEDDIDSVVVGTLNSVLTPTTLNTFRMSWTYENFTSGDVSILDDYTHLSELGPSLEFESFADGVPDLANGGKDRNYTISDTLSFYHAGWGGGHTFKTGVEYSYTANLFKQGGALNGVFEFSESNGPFDQNDPRTYPDRLNIRVPGAEGAEVEASFVGVFFQDKWTPKPGLTLNLGVRYELTTLPLDEKDNPLFSSPSDYPVDTNDIAPRVGFSWDPTGDRRSVVRGGYGLFYDHFRNGDVDQFERQGVFSESFTVNFPADRIDPGPQNGEFPTDPMLAYVIDNGLVVNRALLNELYPPGTVQRNTGTVQYDNPDRRTPYTHTFSLGYSRQLGNTSAVAFDYKHQANRAQSLTRNLNPPRRLGTGRTQPVVRDNPDPRLDREFENNVNLFTNEGQSNYDGFEIEFEKRFSQRHNYRVAYTIARCEELSSDQVLHDLNLSWAPCSDVRRHSLTLSGAVQLLPGLQVSAVSRAFTGERFTIQDTSSDANQNGIFFEPLPAGSYSGNASDTLTIESDGGRNGAAGPSLFQLDMRVSYDIPTGDGKTLNAYFEVVNLTDRVNFSVPNSDRRSGSFMNPTRIFGGIPPRTAQMGFRFTY